MASPGLTFADSIQDVRRLPLGIAFGDTDHHLDRFSKSLLAA